MCLNLCSLASHLPWTFHVQLEVTTAGHTVYYQSLGNAWGRCVAVPSTPASNLSSSPSEPVVCSVCAKTFTRKDYLRCHQKTHALERDVFRCPREGCGRTYTTLFNLQSHIVSFHEEKRPFSCDYPGCGKVFAMKVRILKLALKVHILPFKALYKQLCCSYSKVS